MKKGALLLAVTLLFLMIFSACAEQTEVAPALAWENDLTIGTVTIESRELTEEELETTLPLYGRKIGIDPGHQAKANLEKEAVGPDSKERKTKVTGGTRGVDSGRPEHEVVLEVSLKMRDELEKLGAEVYMTRETADVDISNKERAEMMNDLKADLVLRIHCNGSTNKASNGIGLYVRASGNNTDRCALLAESMMPHMTDATGAKNNGIHRTNTYTGNNWSIPPCVLVEMGFLTNPQEDRLLNDDAYQRKMIDGMILGIIDYFDEFQ